MAHFNSSYFLQKQKQKQKINRRSVKNPVRDRVFCCSQYKHTSWCKMEVCVCFAVLTATAFPVRLEHPGHTTTDGSGPLTGADLITASIVLLAPVGLWRDAKRQKPRLSQNSEFCWIENQKTLAILGTQHPNGVGPDEVEPDWQPQLTDRSQKKMLF